MLRGFTEQETLNFARSVLEETPDMSELRHLYGGYVFPSQDADAVITEPVLHTQHIIAWVSELSLKRPDADENSFVFLSEILGLLPEKSDVSGAVTLCALIQLLAAGAVEMDETDADLNFDATAVTWNALYHAGALTCDHHLGWTLRVANSVALSAIHACIDTLFANWQDLQHTFLNAWSSYSLSDDPQLFLELLSRFLCDLTILLWRKT
ncbi:hypothetical protein DFH09DRAFT_457865 [Mycena vulgaris]|nr:hypothetical protein DFH09DRAFT_457865 [Mycena vulgaris]